MVKWLNGQIAAAKPITCYFVFTTLLYSLTQILNTQFQHPIIYIQFVVHPFTIFHQKQPCDMKILFTLPFFSLWLLLSSTSVMKWLVKTPNTG
jgi:hypothetical protein